jgi:ABC-2 type transport system permease protein
MSIRRIRVLVGKELKYRSTSFFLVFAIVGPIMFTLMIKLVFGSLFAEKPKLGIYDQGQSKIVAALQNMESINLKQFASESELKETVNTGARDVGIVLERNFDATIYKGELTKITSYIWGESQLKNRAIIGSTFLYRMREFSGKKVPVEIIPVSLGDKSNIPWEERLLPLLVLMTIFISGFTLPASSLVDEKQKRTIGALLTTPVTHGELFISKGVMGSMISIIMGIMILLLNQSLNEQLGLIILLLCLGATLASCFGLLLGAFINDIAALYSAIKGLGIFLYGPGIIKMFPQIPQWLGKIFPTYYIMNPIMEITRNDGTWSTIKFDVFILIGIIALFMAIVGFVANKTSQQIA